MTLKPYAMALRTQNMEQELLLKHEEKLRFHTHSEESKIRWPTQNPKMMQYLDIILHDFKQKVPDLVPSTIFDWIPSQQRNRAKKLLGCKSIRIKNVWYWTIPQRNIDGAVVTATRENVDAEKIRAKILMLRRPVADRLNAVMKRYNWDGIASNILLEMGYSRRSVLKVKALLGVVSYKQHDGDKLWHWVYPHSSVQDWLTEQFPDGTEISMREFHALAAQRGYSRRLIEITSMLVGISRSYTRDEPYYVKY